MKNKTPTHLFNVRVIAPLWTRINAALGAASINTWIVAAMLHFLNLTDSERDVAIRNYVAMVKAGKK